MKNQKGLIPQETQEEILKLLFYHIVENQSECRRAVWAECGCFLTPVVGVKFEIHRVQRTWNWRDFSD